MILHFNKNENDTGYQKTGNHRHRQIFGYIHRSLCFVNGVIWEMLSIMSYGMQWLALNGKLQVRRTVGVKFWHWGIALVYKTKTVRKQQTPTRESTSSLPAPDYLVRLVNTSRNCAWSKTTKTDCGVGVLHISICPKFSLPRLQYHIHVWGHVLGIRWRGLT